MNFMNFRTTKSTSIVVVVIRVMIPKYPAAIRNLHFILFALQPRFLHSILPTSTMSDTFTIHYFATVSQYTLRDTESLPSPQSLSTLFDTLEESYPEITAKVLSTCCVSLDGEYVDIETDGDVLINSGAEVALIPPVSSG